MSNQFTYETDEDRFFSKVDIKGDDECWEWKAATRAGYGSFWYLGEQVPAHRFSYEFFNGPIPKGMLVRHLVCDNPLCVNPRHLALGTQVENMEDMKSKGRSCKGDKHYSRR